MSLRQAKREKLRRSILANAIALFRAAGFEATRVRDIAERCEISEATFFNYFPTKDAVVGAWVYEQLADEFSRAAASASGSLRPTLRGLARKVAAPVQADPEFARCTWARARLANFPPPDGATLLIRAAQRNGELRRDVPAEELASILLSVTAASVSSWLAEPEWAAAADAKLGTAPERAGRSVRSSPETNLEQRLRRALDLVLDGSRRRHERVRPSAQRGESASGFA